MVRLRTPVPKRDEKRRHTLLKFGGIDVMSKRLYYLLAFDKRSGNSKSSQRLKGPQWTVGKGTERR
jgi:hypothetical protein